MKRKYLSYEETKNILPIDVLKEKLKTNTYREIATQYGMDERIVSKLAQKEYNISKDFNTIRKNANKDKIVNFDEYELIDLYINKKMSMRQIAEYYGVTHNTVSKKLKDMNIEIRPFCYLGYYNNRRKNSILRYIDSGGYYMLFINGKFIREHRYIMELYLNRPLTDDETVHHIDFDRLNNDINNLFLFDHQKYHTTYHGFIKDNDYISPKEFLEKYKTPIDIIYDYSFLYDLYVSRRMSANAIHKYVLNKYSFSLDRQIIIKILKEYKIYELISPTINQYDSRICINDI